MLLRRPLSPPDEFSSRRTKVRIFKGYSWILGAVHVPSCHQSEEPPAIWVFSCYPQRRQPMVVNIYHLEQLFSVTDKPHTRSPGLDVALRHADRMPWIESIRRVWHHQIKTIFRASGHGRNDVYRKYSWHGRRMDREDPVRQYICAFGSFARGNNT